MAGLRAVRDVLSFDPTLQENPETTAMSSSSRKGSGQKVSFPVEWVAIGMVIGRQGNTLRQLEKRFGVAITTDQKGEKPIVCIRGPEGRIADARKEIDVILSRVDYSRTPRRKFQPSHSPRHSQSSTSSRHVVKRASTTFNKRDKQMLLQKLKTDLEDIDSVNKDVFPPRKILEVGITEDTIAEIIRKNVDKHFKQVALEGQVDTTNIRGVLEHYCRTDAARLSWPVFHDYTVGAAHSRLWTVACYVTYEGKELRGLGTNQNKKKAREEAAHNALNEYFLISNAKRTVRETKKRKFSTNMTAFFSGKKPDVKPDVDAKPESSQPSSESPPPDGMKPAEVTPVKPRTLVTSTSKVVASACDVLDLGSTPCSLTEFPAFTKPLSGSVTTERHCFGSIVQNEEAKAHLADDVIAHYAMNMKPYQTYTDMVFWCHSKATIWAEHRVRVRICSQNPEAKTLVESLIAQDVAAELFSPKPRGFDHLIQTDELITPFEMDADGGVLPSRGRAPAPRTPTHRESSSRRSPPPARSPPRKPYDRPVRRSPPPSRSQPPRARDDDRRRRPKDDDKHRDSARRHRSPSPKRRSSHTRDPRPHRHESSSKYESRSSSSRPHKHGSSRRDRSPAPRDSRRSKERSSHHRSRSRDRHPDRDLGHDRDRHPGRDAPPTHYSAPEAYSPEPAHSYAPPPAQLRPPPPPPRNPYPQEPLIYREPDPYRQPQQPTHYEHALAPHDPRLQSPMYDHQQNPHMYIDHAAEAYRDPRLAAPEYTYPPTQRYMPSSSPYGREQPGMQQQAPSQSNNAPESPEDPWDPRLYT